MNQDPQTSDLNQLVKRLEAAQTAVKQSDKLFVARFRNGSNELLLGSDRTWQRMKEGDYENLTPTKWLTRVRQAVEILTNGGLAAVEIYKDFPFLVEGKKQVEILEQSKNDRRILVALGTTGTGKTTLARACVYENPDSRKYIMASPAWKSGPDIALGIYNKLTGARIVNTGYSDVLEKLVDFLQLNETTVFIDQAERGGTSLMTLLIHLVDETPSRFAYLAYPTHYYRIISATTGALAETKQFIGRCIKPVFDSYAGGTKLADVRCVLRHAEIKLPKSDTEEILAKIVATGGMRTFGDAIELARKSADEANVDVDGALLLDSLDKVTGLLKVEQKQEELEAAA